MKCKCVTPKLQKDNVFTCNRCGLEVNLKKGWLYRELQPEIDALYVRRKLMELKKTNKRLRQQLRNNINNGIKNRRKK